MDPPHPEKSSSFEDSSQWHNRQKMALQSNWSGSRWRLPLPTRLRKFLSRLGAVCINQEKRRTGCWSSINVLLPYRVVRESNQMYTSYQSCEMVCGLANQPAHAPLFWFTIVPLGITPLGSGNLQKATAQFLMNSVHAVSPPPGKHAGLS
jgi:hypothetical protein